MLAVTTFEKITGAMKDLLRRLFNTFVGEVLIILVVLGLGILLEMVK
jgi:hypothetical protein